MFDFRDTLADMCEFASFQKGRLLKSEVYNKPDVLYRSEIRNREPGPVPTQS